MFYDLPFKILTHTEQVIPLNQARVTLKCFDPAHKAAHPGTLNLYIEATSPLFDVALHRSATHPTSFCNTTWVRSAVLQAKSSKDRTTLHLQRYLPEDTTPEQARLRLLAIASSYTQMFIAHEATLTESEEL